MLWIVSTAIQIVLHFHIAPPKSLTLLLSTLENMLAQMQVAEFGWSGSNLVNTCLRNHEKVTGWESPWKKAKTNHFCIFAKERERDLFMLSPQVKLNSKETLPLLRTYFCTAAISTIITNNNEDDINDTNTIFL